MAYKEAILKQKYSQTERYNTKIEKESVFRPGSIEFKISHVKHLLWIVIFYLLYSVAGGESDAKTEKEGLNRRPFHIAKGTL